MFLLCPLCQLFHHFLPFFQHSLPSPSLHFQPLHSPKCPQSQTVSRPSLSSPHHLQHLALKPCSQVCIIMCLA
ncbi:hypothetical protein JHK82_020668 [Glycine max]|nr:hypothetical protein JHK86_020680 [Glycine max]KAG5135937.1 hypothetical protein JHK82_020668 [Glycine max]